MATQFAHFNLTSQSLLEPLASLRLVSNTGITDPNTLWINNVDGNVYKGTTNIDGAISSLINTIGSIGMTPSGATTTGTFTLHYTVNSDICVFQIVQAAPVSQVALPNNLVFTNNLPVGLRPTNNIKNPIFVTNGVTDTLGWITVTTAGIVTIGSGPSGTFTGLLGNLFVFPTSIIYSV